MSKIRRINMFGGPGSCKSTLSSYLFSNLKMQGKRIEQINEYIKFWTYIPRSPKSFDSVYIMSKQIHQEDTILRGDTDLIVTDSPLLLQCFFAWHHQAPGQQSMLQLAFEMESLYPSLNILLKRKDEFYDKVGRYENIEEAKKIDNKMKILFDNLNINYTEFDCTDSSSILSFVLDKINE